MFNRAEGALSSGCTTTDYSPTILECPLHAHRGCSERYPDLFETCKVAQNRHEPRPWIVLQGQGAVGRVPRAYGGSNSTCLTPRTPVFGLLPGARASADCEPAQINFRAEGALSSGCTTTDYSPTILECPGDAHRGCSERYPDLFETWKVAQNRHGPRHGPPDWPKLPTATSLSQRVAGTSHAEY